MIKWVLFLAAVFLSLPTWVLADEVGFQDGIASGTSVDHAAMRSGLSRADSLNGALMGADVNIGHFTIPRTGQSGWSVAEDRFDSRRGFASIVQVEDGVISISVPEPGTMGTLATGLALLAGLRARKGSKSNCFLH